MDFFTDQSHIIGFRSIAYHPSIENLWKKVTEIETTIVGREIYRAHREFLPVPKFCGDETKIKEDVSVVQV